MTKLREEALDLHRKYRGKLGVFCKVPCSTQEDLSLIYTPGVAEPCKEIATRVEDVYEYTIKGNMVGVITNGTAVLGLGDIGPEAALPVMEGKAILFKNFAGIDAFPICINSKDVDEIVTTVKLISPVFGGINLEDIAAPACFEIEERLKKELDIPVFHDDQHGTAVVTLAGLINALKITGKKFNEIEVVISGAGAAGVAITKILLSMGVKDVILCDRLGAIYKGRKEHMNPIKEEIAKITNKKGVTGSISEVMKGTDVFIGVSVGGLVTKDMVRQMADDPIIFAMANPDPEIMPDDAREGGARIVGTGRSDFPNQINNVLGFPGIFRGALDVRAMNINEEMKIAAAYAIASTVKNDELREDYIIPKPTDPRVVPRVALKVAEAAMKTGVARVKKDLEELEEEINRILPSL
jgi:malate dehydrogenase (oxaloacetate-decarboxylating)